MLDFCKNRLYNGYVIKNSFERAKMKPENALNKIMKLEDSNLKLMKLFSFSCNKAVSGGKLWQTAQNEFDRLWQLGYRITQN